MTDINTPSNGPWGVTIKDITTYLAKPGKERYGEIWKTLTTGTEFFTEDELCRRFNKVKREGREYKEKQKDKPYQIAINEVFDDYKQKLYEHDLRPSCKSLIGSLFHINATKIKEEIMDQEIEPVQEDLVGILKFKDLLLGDKGRKRMKFGKLVKKDVELVVKKLEAIVGKDFAYDVTQDFLEQKEKQKITGRVNVEDCVKATMKKFNLNDTNCRTENTEEELTELFKDLLSIQSRFF